MDYFSNKYTIRFCFIISLESINIEKNHNILSSNTQEFKNSINTDFYNYVKKQNQLCQIKSLSTMQNILNRTKKRDEKDKIISILKYYSSKNRYSCL